jgi:hypothetical protein
MCVLIGLVLMLAPCCAQSQTEGYTSNGGAGISLWAFGSLEEWSGLPPGNPLSEPFTLTPALGNGTDLGGVGSFPQAPSSAPWRPTHYEFEGIMQWKNFSTKSSISTGPNTTINFSSDLGFSGLSLGPLVRFLWTPEYKLLGASSKLRIEYGEIPRSHNIIISRGLEFLGETYAIDVHVRDQLKTQSFEVSYSPQWGDDKFKVGPLITYQLLTLKFSLSNLSPGASPPTTRAVSFPNSAVLLGGTFDFTPIHQVEAYGFLGAIPCCGGGWHEFDSEFGLKYHVAQHFSVLGGVRYSYLTRTFNFSLPREHTVAGFLRWPGVGPFIGIGLSF